MTIIVKLLKALLVALYLSSFVRAADVSLLVTPEKDRYVVGEPIILRCTYSNTSETTTNVDLGDNEMQNISFVINPEKPNRSVRPYTMFRGGGKIPEITRLVAHESFTRYVVLDQWLRPTETGVLPLELHVHSKTHDIAAHFTINVGHGGENDITNGVNAIVDKFESLRTHAKNLDAREVLSYEWALIIAFSYLSDAPDEIWRDVRTRYGERSYIFELIRTSKSMHPGGRGMLD